MVTNVRMDRQLFLLVPPNTDEAFALANASCQKYGTLARMSGRMSGGEEPSWFLTWDGPGALSFDCVPPSSAVSQKSPVLAKRPASVAGLAK